MGVEVFTCEQGSPAWFECRLGIPTASKFATVMAKPREEGGGVRRTYLLELAGEILTGEASDSYSNHHMERGKEFEPVARDLYAMRHDGEVDQVGFVRNGKMGCSPDGLIRAEGGAEIKTKLPHLLLDLMLKGAFPPAHKAQVQGSLLVTGRDWWELAVYWPKLPLVVLRATPERDYIANLKGELDRFNDELAALVELARRYGITPKEAAA